MKFDALLTGLAAGAATALLFAGLVVQSPGALGLALIAPVPVLLASLGWGSKAGFLAAATAFIAIAAFLGSLNAGLTVLLSAGLPSAILGHVAGLARPIDGPEPAPTPFGKAPAAPAMDWYPVSGILFAIALLATAACIGLGWLIGYDPSEVGPAVAAALQAQSDASGVSPEQAAELGRFVVAAVPFVQPAFLVLTLVICLYLSAAITRLSGRLPRPKDDLPATTTLPRLALPIFAVALAACFLPGTIGLLGAVAVGSFSCAFTFVGLASVHRRTRGRAARGLLLFTTYAAILLLSFPLLAFMVLGLFETAKPPASPAANA
ncbi:hypothetical protein [Aureimonas sp. AU12]|uniref:hypothetical protein n=1 Tax=Aureimonas sp. AU12 TaxID=1638161 RepID=UPI0007863165|nr:hypothetical protein [Aureimonas sp. AU12]